MLFSDEYAKFIMPTAEELAEERYISSLSSTEEELYFLRLDMLDGKIFKMDDERYKSLDGIHTCYEDAISFIIFNAVESGKITEEEGNCLYDKYVS